MASPRFQQFQQVGDYIVLTYYDFTSINPRNGRSMSDAQHWYEVRCLCGNTELRSQQELRDTRRHRACKSCRDNLQMRKAA